MKKLKILETFDKIIKILFLVLSKCFLKTIHWFSCKLVFSCASLVHLAFYKYRKVHIFFEQLYNTFSTRSTSHNLWYFLIKTSNNFLKFQPSRNHWRQCMILEAGSVLVQRQSRSQELYSHPWLWTFSR